MRRTLTKRLAVAMSTAVVAVGIASTSGATPPGPVTIVTAIDFSSFPFSGTFVVIEGADRLGCSAGTFVDTPFGAAIRKNFTCGVGGTGGFTAVFEPLGAKPGPGNANGHWTIEAAAGDFVGLRGEGDFSVVFVPPASGVETLRGRIHYHP